MIQLLDNILIGSLREAQDIDRLSRNGIRSVLACSAYMPSVVPGVLYGLLHVDADSPWKEGQKTRAHTFILEALPRGKLLVYSDFGRNRAPAAVLYYLVGEGLSQAEALTLIRQKYPSSRIHPAILGEKVASPRINHFRISTSPVPLSIITVTWNREAMVEQCIQSLLSHTEDPFELIVVDNGSTDGTLKFLHSLGDRITLIEVGQNMGKGKAANVGFALAQGDWIAYFDSDIIVPEGWLSEVKKAYEDTPAAGWLSLPYEGLPIAIPISGGMVFLSKNRLREIGGFVENRLYGLIDIEYAERARGKGYLVGYAESNKQITHLGKDDEEDYKAWKERVRFEPQAIATGPAPSPVDIIIVRYNLPEMEEQCLRAVREHTHYPYKLTVVDNYPTKERLGVLWNQVIEQSLCSHICLLNSDTLVTEGWLSKLMATFGADPQIAVVGPSTNCSATPQQIIQYLDPEMIETFSSNLSRAYEGEWEEAEVSGFCYLLRKEAWEEVGGFSKSFGFYGQETHLNKKLQQAGYKTVWRRDSFVFHHGGASAKKAAEEGEMDLDLDRVVATKVLEREGE